MSVAFVMITPSRLDTVSTRFDFKPGGALADGIMERSVPGGSFIVAAVAMLPWSFVRMQSNNGKMQFGGVAGLELREGTEGLPCDKSAGRFKYWYPCVATCMVSLGKHYSYFQPPRFKYPCLPIIFRIDLHEVGYDLQISCKRITEELPFAAVLSVTEGSDAHAWYPASLNGITRVRKMPTSAIYPDRFINTQLAAAPWQGLLLSAQIPSTRYPESVSVLGENAKLYLIYLREPSHWTRDGSVFNQVRLTSP